MGEGKSKKKKGKTYFENPVRFEDVHAKTSVLSAPHDLAPIAERARARPQRPVRPQDGAERRRRLEPLGGVNELEDFARHGEVVLDRLLVRYITPSSHKPKNQKSKKRSVSFGEFQGERERERKRKERRGGTRTAEETGESGAERTQCAARVFARSCGGG
jgi:hypothetical protein